MPFLIPAVIIFSIVMGLLMTKPDEGKSRFDENTALIVPFGFPIAILLLLYLPVHYMIKGYKSEKPSPKDVPLQKAFEALSPERRDEIDADVMDYEVNHVLWNRESRPAVWWETDRTNTPEWLRELYIKGQYPSIPDLEDEQEHDQENELSDQVPWRGIPAYDPGRILDLTTREYFLKEIPNITHEVTRIKPDVWCCTCFYYGQQRDDGNFGLSGIRDHLNGLMLAGYLLSRVEGDGKPSHTSARDVALAQPGAGIITAEERQEVIQRTALPYKPPLSDPYPNPIKNERHS